MQISIITTCKGRWCHLSQTLPSMFFQLDFPRNDYEIIVVDYGDPDKSAELSYSMAKKEGFKNFKAIKVLDNTELWNPSRARNIGANSATNDFLLFLDADVFIAPKFLNYLHQIYQQTNFEVWHRDIHIRHRGSLNGSFCVQKKCFHRIRGYNEIGIGWSMEDVDIYKRLDRRRYHTILFGLEAPMHNIDHSNLLRCQFTKHKSVREQIDNTRSLFHQTKSNPNPNGYGKCQRVIFDMCVKG